MPFTILPDGRGKLFVPEGLNNAPRKHPCPDCYSCQMCSDDRCEPCRKHHCRRKMRPAGKREIF